MLLLLLSCATPSTTSNPAAYENYTKLVLIGDSVDRNAVTDWCHANQGILCNQLRPKNWPASWNPGLQATTECNTNDPAIIEQVTVDKDRLAFAHDMHICIHHEQKVIVVYQFNGWGFTPQMYCSSEVSTL
jgi:hypothetical protein